MPPRRFICHLVRRTLFASRYVPGYETLPVSHRLANHRCLLHTTPASGVPRWRLAVTTLRGTDQKVDAEEAKNFVFLLEPSERELILKELQSFQDEPGDPLPPTPGQLQRLGLFCALPFVGFGFLDNFLMIIAGGYIEVGIGAIVTISTMAAAGLGNAVSDVVGVWSTGPIEHYVSKLGITPPHLTPKQTGMRITRWVMNMGRAFGITVGCIIGMFPLLIYDFDTKDKKDEKKEPAEK